MDKVIAVVVTHNRRKLLSECIDALRNQTRKLDAIFVVNNGSTDDTEQWLREQTDVDFITQSNLGGAGGFSRGIQTGYIRGYHWIWCMDDDGAPKEDALENLLAAENHELRLLNCAVINKEDKKSFVWKTGSFKTIDEVNQHEIRGVGHPFNGTLINHRIVERVGAPKQHLFLWGDETEYYYRITRRNNIPVTTVAGSIHYHPAAAFSLTKNWDFENGWKLYYYIRNRYHIQKTKFNNKGLALVHYVCFIAAFAGMVLFFQRTNKLKKLNFIFWPVADAFKNNFSATPSIIMQKLQQQHARSYVQAILQPMRNAFYALFIPTATAERSNTAAV